MVAAGATVPPGMHVPDGMLAAGVPARVVGELTAGARKHMGQVCLKFAPTTDDGDNATVALRR